MKIRTMLMISAKLFAILPMVIYTVFANTLLSSDGDKQFRNTLLEVAENERYTLQTYLDTVDKQAETILKNTEVQDVIKSQKTTDYVGNYLVQFANENPEIDSISLVDKDGKIFCKKCEVAINLATIGFKGGCNPIPFPYKTGHGKITIQTTDLDALSAHFR